MHCLSALVFYGVNVEANSLLVSSVGYAFLLNSLLLLRAFCSLLSGGEGAERLTILSTIIIKCEGMTATQQAWLQVVGVAKTLPTKGGVPKMKIRFQTNPQSFPNGDWKNGVMSFYVPRLNISYPLSSTFDPSLYFSQLPNMHKQTKEKICVMVTPMLKGSTFFIRGDFSSSGNNAAATPPQVCHLRVQMNSTPLTANLNLSIDLHKYALTSNQQEIRAKGPARSQVRPGVRQQKE